MSIVSVVMLKSELSRFLAAARGGAEVVVTAHRQPVARLIPYHEKGHLNIARPRLASSALKRLRGVKPLRTCDPVQALMADRARR